MVRDRCQEEEHIGGSAGSGGLSGGSCGRTPGRLRSRLRDAWLGTAAFLLGAACLFWAGGCGGRTVVEPRGDFIIGVVTKSRNSEYWMSVCAGMEKAAREQNVQVVVFSPDTEDEKDVQKKMIRDLLKMEVDALAVSPIDSYDNQDYIELAGQLEIPVYSYDTPVMDAEVPYIGIDNEKVGYQLGNALAGKMGHKGNVAVIAGSREQASHGQRVLGFERYMKEEPDIRIEVMRDGYSNLRVSEKEMEEILLKYPDLDGIMTTSAVTALGLAEATRGTGIAIASVDNQEDAIRAVEEGRIAVLGAQSGYDIGYETVNYIVNDKNGIGQEDEKILDTQILTQENVKEYQNLKK